MIKELKDFLFNGNIVEIGVGLALALAFVTLMTSFMDNIISPILGLLPGVDSLNTLTATIGGATFNYGMFIAAVITFMAVGTVLFFVLKAYNKAAAMNMKEDEIVVEAPAEDIVLLREIRDQLRTNA